MIRNTARGVLLVLTLLSVAAQPASAQEGKSKQTFVEALDLLKANKFQAATAKFEQGLKAEPDNAMAHFYAGEGYLGLKQNTKAEAHYKRSLELGSASSVADDARKRLAGLSGTGSVVSSSPIAKPAADAPSPVVAAGPKPGSEFKDCDACPAMVVVPPGQFVMGSPPNESGRYDSEGPPHAVTIAHALAVGKYEITFDEWDACVADRGCARADDSGFGRGRRPVINVSYKEAVGYAGWLSDKTKKKYRLLTEAEWEYAARAGSDKSRFWGSSPEHACQYANVFNRATRTKYKDFDREAFDCDDGYVETAPAGSFKPNAFGLYDMLGNVWEWVEDCWNGSYSKAPADGSAWSTGDCSKRVLRGGGWYYGSRNVRSAKRNWGEPSKRGHDLGFRIARALP